MCAEFRVGEVGQAVGIVLPCQEFVVAFLIFEPDSYLFRVRRREETGVFGIPPLGPLGQLGPTFSHKAVGDPTSHIVALLQILPGDHVTLDGSVHRMGRFRSEKLIDADPSTPTIDGSRQVDPTRRVSERHPSMYILEFLMDVGPASDSDAGQ